MAAVLRGFDYAFLGRLVTATVLPRQYSRDRMSGTVLLATLSESDLAFLDALRAGESAPHYAERIHYSKRWAKWKSRRIRDRLGVATIKEAVRLSEEAGVTRSEFEGLQALIKQTNEAIENLAKASPQDKQAAETQVRERELSEKDLAAKLGISLDDVKRVRDENEYGKFKTMQERLDAERAAVVAEEEKLEEEKPQTDGLGGVFNLTRNAK